MTNPEWIEEAAVHVIHSRQLQRHGGMEGIRDSGLLQSALGRPMNLWAYSRDTSDLAALAASYTVGIARNHPFLDGNKRTAAVVCETFLQLNGELLTANDDQWYDTMIQVAAGEMAEETLVEWIRERLEAKS